jgi:hypothetical protein
MVPARYSIPYVSFHPLYIVVCCSVVEHPNISSAPLYVFPLFHCPYVYSQVASVVYKDMSMIIDSIPGTWSVDQPKKYEPVSVSWLVKFVVVVDY